LLLSLSPPISASAGFGWAAAETGVRFAQLNHMVIA